MSTQNQQLSRKGQSQSKPKKASSSGKPKPNRSQHGNPVGQQSRNEKSEVVVTDVDISFGNMVMLLVKLAFASIPAMIIVWMVMSAIAAMLMALFGIGGSMLAGG